MQEKAKSIKLDYYINLILKHRWLIIIPFCLSMLGGIFLSFTLPKIYETSTLILIEPQKVPKNYVQSIVTIDVSTRINTIRQQILSRSNIEKLIRELNLFSNPDHKNVFLENNVELVRSRVGINVGRRRAKRGPNSFSIFVKDEVPERAVKIANGLAFSFISENIK